MSSLDKRYSVITALLLLLISSCEQDEKTINVNLKDVTNTSYAEFTIPTSEIFIDSLNHMLYIHATMMSTVATSAQLL